MGEIIYMIDRYSNPEISKIWSLENKFEIWKDIEILACEARMNRGEIPETEFYEIKTKAKFKVEEILKLEETLQHDVIAFLTNLGSYIGPASRHVHHGLTSSDIGDTALCVQMKQAIEIKPENISFISDTEEEINWSSILFVSKLIFDNAHDRREPYTGGNTGDW
jgi:adenylosuccinate lyase